MDNLTQQGLNNIALAEMQMGALTTLSEQFAEKTPFLNLRIGMALHVTKETAVLVKTLRAAGAEIWITGCNPLSTQNDIVAALLHEGINVFGHKGESQEQYYQFLNQVIDCRPHITIDDGCDLVSELHRKRPDMMSELIGGSEETTTGIIRLKAMEADQALKCPMIAVNDNLTKHLMDNYYGTGQSTLDGIMRACNFMFAGKTTVVAGYGSCGKGIAKRLQGLGAKVIVTEINPFRALQAGMDGHTVMPMVSAAKIGDLFITVTGNIDVITSEHIKLMKNGAIMCNSGHFDCEINLKSLAAIARNQKKVRPYMDEYQISETQKVYILGEGRLVNLAAAEGHPSDIMSLSFCGQFLACKYLVEHHSTLENKVYSLPEEIDNYISKLQLKEMGIEIDQLTASQEKYLESWESGT